MESRFGLKPPLTLPLVGPSNVWPSMTEHSCTDVTRQSNLTILRGSIHWESLSKKNDRNRPFLTNCRFMGGTHAGLRGGT